MLTTIRLFLVTRLMLLFAALAALQERTARIGGRIALASLLLIVSAMGLGGAALFIWFIAAPGD